MEEAEPIQRIGRVFQRYLPLDSLKPASVGSELSSESRGRSYFSLDRTTGEPVVLLAAPSLPEEEEALFLRCLKLFRNSTISSLPQILAGENTASCAYISTAWVPGIFLSDLLPLETGNRTQGIDLLWSISRALSVLHSQNFVHGDIHPHNILINPTGRLFLTGYLPAPLGTSCSSVSAAMPSLRYGAPECYSCEEATPTGDVFSLGLVAFEIFAGQRLLRVGKKEELELDLDLLSASLESVLDRHDSLDAEQKELLLSMLKHSPEERIGCGSELLDWIVRTHPDCSQERLTKGLRLLLTRALPKASQRLLDSAEQALEQGQLLPAMARLWRYAGFVPRTDVTRTRRGYLLAIRLFWQGFLKTSADLSEEEKQGLAGIFLLLHRLADRWDSSTLRSLSLVMLFRVTQADSPERKLVKEPRIPPERRKELLHKYRSALEKRPTSERSLLALAVYTKDFRPRPEESLYQVKFRILQLHRLFRQALYHRSQEILVSKNFEPILEDLEKTIPQALENDALEAKEPKPPSDAPFDFKKVVADAQALRAHRLANQSQVHESDTFPTLDAVTLDPKETFLGGASFFRDLPEMVTPQDAAKFHFERGQELLRQQRLEQATEVFRELHENGLWEQEYFYSDLVTEIRNLLWGILPQISPQNPQAVSILQKIWDLAQTLQLETLMPLCERLLVNCLDPKSSFAVTQKLLKKRPQSLQLLQAAASAALREGKFDRWSAHLVAAARILIHRGDLVTSARLLMAARQPGEVQGFEEAYQSMFRLAERVAQSSVMFRALQLQAQDRPPKEQLKLVSVFLSKVPDFLPARLAYLDLAKSLDASIQANEILLGLGLDELVRENFAKAREYFARILTSQFDHDEAMLYLASIPRSAVPYPKDPRLLRIWLLEQENLLPAAIYQAERQLEGGLQDQALREKLVELCVRLGQDPSHHRLALGLLALKRGEPEQAQFLCHEAFTESTDPNALVKLSLKTPGIETIFTRLELIRYRTQDSLSENGPLTNPPS